MKIVIAPDSFKESLSAEKVAMSLQLGFENVWPEANYISLPMADGGEGTVETLTNTAKGRFVECKAHDPLMRPINVRFGLVADGTIAVIEAAEASGLALLSEVDRDPTVATSYGTGEIILHALELGVRRFIIGIGGTGTNDGGAGIAQALGYLLLDSIGVQLVKGGSTLNDLARIDDSAVHPGLKESRIQIACDVTNPMCGSNGATMVYGPQKGLSDEQIPGLEDSMKHFASILDAYAGRDVSNLPGSGAGGGMAGGLLAFTHAELVPGFDLISKACHLEEAIRTCDLVVTGEGRIDIQTGQGKVPAGVARIARDFEKPVVAFCGMASDSTLCESNCQFNEIIPVANLAIDMPDSMNNASKYLALAAESFARRWTRVLD